MFQVRIHGRGGQGVLSGAEMLSVAAFLEGRHAQAFPSFGSEHMGAPVTAFCRIDDKEIRTREPAMEPDALLGGFAAISREIKRWCRQADRKRECHPARGVRRQWHLSSI